MIPPKLLVYRRTHSDTNLETLRETRRRKKSCGDLFQNGYRVRQGHHGQEEKEGQTGLYHSVWSCLGILCSWGKGVSFSVHTYNIRRCAVNLFEFIHPDLGDRHVGIVFYLNRL